MKDEVFYGKGIHELEGEYPDLYELVKNISDVAGEEVVQVYISRENTPVYTFPLKKLVAFARVDLKPGESKTVTFTIAPRQLSMAGRNMEDASGEIFLVCGKWSGRTIERNK